jgi:translocation and assembly module TamB
VGHAALGGTLRAEALRVDAPQYGVHFSDGRLAAHLADGNVVLDELVLAAGAGQFRASGTLVTAGNNGTLTAERVAWRASKFRLFNRPDLRLVVDGEGTVTSDKGRFALSGALRADEGRIVYNSDPGAMLGDDVVVKGRPRQTAATLRAADLPLTVDLALDFGDKLSVESEGLDTGLSGTVRVTTGSRGLIGKGSISMVNGTYFAFGRKLVIDPGRLVFDGPLDNPGLDIVALRKNLAVEAGVAVRGTVKVPIIQLTSNVPVSDGEKLSWLVLGQGLDRTSGTDIAALQAASAILLGRNSKPITATIAERVGLDEIAVKGTSSAAAGASGASATAGQVVAVGKRLSDKISLVYEQGLTVANSALKIEYSLTRNITVRAETGVVSGIGIQYHRSFE